VIPTAVSSILVPLVQRFEGCVLEAYLDATGIWTIGWGHTGPEVFDGLVWTQEQADAVLETDLAAHYDQLLAISPRLASSATPSQLAALTDFLYNLGAGTYRNSTLRSAAEAGAWQNAKLQLAKWVHAGGKVLPGLVARRSAEIALLDA
jgi:lysozyme